MLCLTHFLTHSFPRRTHYQPQFSGASDYGPTNPTFVDRTLASSSASSTSSLTQVNALIVGDLVDVGANNDGAVSKSPSEDDNDNSDSKATKPKFKHVYQTIFLDRDGAKDLWTKDEISKDEIILEKWWKQQSHRVQHYRSTVPWMALLNGRNHTRFAGAWSILNMHEIAVVSGFAAACTFSPTSSFCPCSVPLIDW